MINKRTIFVSIIIALSLLFTGLTALLCLYIFVPRYVESEVIPSIAGDNGIEISSLKVRNIGLTGAEISDIKIGNGKDESLAIDSIRLDYSISGLFGRQIKKIAFSGISVGLEFKDNRIYLKGLEALTSNQEPDTKKDSDLSKPFTVNSLSVTSSILNLLVNNKKLIIPFDFYATSFYQNKLPDKFKLEIYPNSQAISVEGNIDNDKDIKLNLSFHALSLSNFENVIYEVVPLGIKGQADIELSANLSQDPISITDLSAVCRLKKTAIDYPGIKIRNSITSDNIEQPVALQIESKDLNHWEYRASNILADTSLVPVMLEISGAVNLSKDVQTGNIKALSWIMTGDDPSEIEWDITVERDTNTNSLTTLINGKPKMGETETPSIKAMFDDIAVAALSPEINARVEYKKGALSGTYLLAAEKLTASSDIMQLSLPMLSIKGSLAQDEVGDEKYMSSFSLNGKKIVFKNLDVTADIPDYLVSGSVQYDMTKGVDCNAQVVFEKGHMSMSDGSLSASKISGEIPLSWPLDKNRQKGKLSIGKIKYDNYLLGPVNVDISQRGSEIPFSGTILFPIFPDMAINLAGNTTYEPIFGEVKIKVDVPEYNQSSQIDLGKLLPALKGYYYKGNLKSSADIVLSDSGLKSGLDLKINNGTLKNSEKNLSLENISVDLKIEDLISIKSSFGQRLKIAKISFGDIQAEDFTIDFKVDGLSLLFIEKGSFKWCSGSINIQSFRVNPDKEEYDLVLFCDRLKLAEILAQFGVANASGGGTVNGKLPVKISKNKISFDNGFLYSTPGGGGKINITETDMLTKGLDPNSAEYTQMDIAREAIKAYDYTWVKMTFETEKDDLTLKLQFDGKPENKLPFKYSENEKKFIRTNNDTEWTEFKGIGLDVNFRVPIDEILNIKDALDMMK